MESSQENINNWVILNMIEGVGSLRIKKLLVRFGTPAGILAASQTELAKVDGIGKELSCRIACWRENVDLKKELELVSKYGASILTIDDSVYPERLREIYDPPVVIYVRGEPSCLNDDAIAIVGTRRPSFYGRSITEKLAAQLAMRGFTVVSGMARGIDSAAHRGALSVRGKTIAVLGCGIDKVYPPENVRLMKEIAGSGAVVSEFPLGTGPDRGNFPRRNRIISGLSLGVIVVEAAKSSGSLITADLALEQGREVFAVPGKVDSPTSYGTHRLIKEGAKLIQDIDDVIEELGPRSGLHKRSCSSVHVEGERGERLSGGSSLEREKPKKSANLPDLATDEKMVYELLSSEPSHIDSICSGTNLPASRVSSALMMLEVKGLIKQLPGKQFVIPVQG